MDIFLLGLFALAPVLARGWRSLICLAGLPAIVLGGFLVMIGHDAGEDSNPMVAIGIAITGVALALLLIVTAIRVIGLAIERRGASGNRS